MAQLADYLRVPLVKRSTTLTIDGKPAATYHNGLEITDERPCFDVCLFEERGELFLSWRRKRLKDEEAVLCANCDTSSPVPRSTRRTGVFYRLLSERHQLSVQRVAPRNRRSQFHTESNEYSSNRRRATAHRLE
jgi:hypothetical protein